MALVEVEVVIGTRYRLLIDAGAERDPLLFAGEVADGWVPWDDNCNVLAVASDGDDRAVDSVAFVEDVTPAEWAADNGGETA